MTTSKGWEWEIADEAAWTKPADIVYYLAHKWRELGYRKILDLGSGLGRHAVFFAQQGFEVAALDISEYAVKRLESWAEKEQLKIDVRLGDMLELPYEDGAFDCLFAYHVISHTDSDGILKIIAELERVLKPGGEAYLSFSSKDSASFTSGEYPKVDANTILWTLDPEKDVPHFHVNREDILRLLSQFDLISVRHTDYCVTNNETYDSKYYYILGRKK